MKQFRTVATMLIFSAILSLGVGFFVLLYPALSGFRWLAILLFIHVAASAALAVFYWVKGRG